MVLDGSMTSEPLWGTTGRDDEAHRVHEGLQRIAKGRSAYDAEEASLLRDAKALRLWRDHRAQAEADLRDEIRARPRGRESEKPSERRAARAGWSG